MGSADFFLISALILAGLSAFFLIQFLFGTNNDKELLAWASGEEKPKSKSPVINMSLPLVHQLTLKYALKIKNPERRKKIKHLIGTAGMSQEITVDEFLGLQILWGILFPIFMYVFNFAFQIGFSDLVFPGLAVFGYMMPTLHANKMRKDRIISVQADLPFFIDILALSTEAGLDFISAIQRIVDKAQDSVLAEELGSVLKDIKLGSSRVEALKAMAERLDIPETTSFIAVLADADSTGASIATVLKDQSVQMRLERFVRAEKAGAQASQLILIPLMVFILPAVFIMVFGPVAISFSSGGQ